MTDQPLAVAPTTDKRQPDHDLAVTVAMALLISFGVTLFAFSLIYVRDLRTLQELPELVWAFVCGVPKDDQVTLPILVLLSAGSFAAALGVWGWRKLRR